MEFKKNFGNNPQRSSESHFSVEDSNLNVYLNNNDCYGDKKTHPLRTKLGNLDSDPTGFNLPAFSVKKDFSHLLQRTRYSRTLKCERLTDRAIRFWYGNVTWVVKCDLIT